MINKMLEKYLLKSDKSAALAMSHAQEKTLKWLVLIGLPIAAWFVFWSASAPAAEPDLTQFLEIPEVKPILIQTQDSTGQTVNVIDQVDILIRLPNETFARRVRVNLGDTLFLDPRAPVPGQRTYSAILELDGTVAKLPPVRP